MRNLFYSCCQVLFFYWLFFIATSCNSAKDEKAETTAGTNSSDQNAVAAKGGAVPLIGGTLDTLWIASHKFPANPEKIVFSFTIDANDKLMLHGWKVKPGPNQFDPTPNYPLTNGGQHQNKTYGPGIYLGNIVLQQNDVATIRNMINQGHYTKVLFVPALNNNHLYYTIYVGKEDQTIQVMAVDPTNTEANPSPPRNY